MKSKALILTLFFLIVSFSVYSQQTAYDATPVVSLRKFIETTNILQLRKNIYLGKVKGQNRVEIHIWAVEYRKDDSSSVPLKGIKIKLVDRKSEFKHELNAYIDADEVIECISFFNALLNYSEAWENENRPLDELVFVTRDNFKFNFTQEGKKQRDYAQIFYENDYILCQLSSAKSMMSKIKELLDKAYLELNLKAFEKTRNTREAPQ